MADEGELTEVESRLCEAALRGQMLDLRTGDQAADDPAYGAQWEAERTVDAAVLAELATGAEGEIKPRAVRLAGARIKGSLDLEAATVHCPILLRDCWFDEQVNLAEANTRALRFPGCRLPSLRAHHLSTRGNLELDEGFASRGMLFLAYIRIGGSLILSGADLNGDGISFFGDGLVVEEGMFCRQGFSAKGGVRLVGAEIGGNLEFEQATLSNPGGVALAADGLRVGQSLFCRGQFRAEGEIRLAGAHIGTVLDFDNAVLINPAGRALTAGGLRVGPSMMCRKGFKAEGEIFMVGASIGGNLEFNGATLVNPGRDVLIADGLNVGQSLFLTEGFSAQGRIRLTGARINSQLNLSGMKLTEYKGTALLLQEVRAGALVLRNLDRPEWGIDLSHAKVDTLVDEPVSWPRLARLQGFVYDSLFERSPVSSRLRLELLNRDPSGYSPQPYEQLIAVYRRSGRDQDARTVAIAKERARRQNLSPPAKAWSLMLGGLVGHGYRTWFAGVWILGLLGIGALVFGMAYPQEMTLAKATGDRVPAFQAWVYSLDVLLPVVNLHQEDHWIPEGFARWWAWFAILAGWLLTSIVLAALAGLLKRD